MSFVTMSYSWNHKTLYYLHLLSVNIIINSFDLFQRILLVVPSFFIQHRHHYESDNNSHNPDGLRGRVVFEIGEFVGPEMFHENPNCRIEDHIEEEEVPVYFYFLSNFPQDTKNDEVKEHFIELSGVKRLSRKHLSRRAFRRVNQ